MINSAHAQGGAQLPAHSRRGLAHNNARNPTPFAPTLARFSGASGVQQSNSIDQTHRTYQERPQRILRGAHEAAAFAYNRHAEGFPEKGHGEHLRIDLYV